MSLRIIQSNDNMREMTPRTMETKPMTNDMRVAELGWCI